jgi:uncharacterized OB-fold protein
VGPVARDESSAAFFAAAAQGVFLISRCPQGHASKPQAQQCSQSASVDLRLEPASGRARLISWVVVPGRPTEQHPDPPATIPAIAELEEGPWWWSLLVDADPEQLREGAPLTITFERAEGGEPVPVFTPG